MKFSQYNLIITNEHDKESYILFNSFTGATFKIDQNVKEKIENNDLTFLSEDDYQIYKNQGILIEDNIDEQKYFEYFYQKNKFNSDILNLTILLTHACNLKCVYCFQGAGDKKKDSLTDTTREKIYEFIVKQVSERKSKVVGICLFGGEPLLNFKSNLEWLDKIKLYCEENDKILTTSMVTNGTLITDEILNSLKDYNCSMIQITLDGIKEIHDVRRISKNGKGSFDDTIRGIKSINSRDDFNKPTIRINIDKNNIMQTYELLEYLRDENLTDCGIDFGIVRGGTEACASYSGHCFVEEEIGDVLEDLWRKGNECGFKLNPSPSSRTLFCGLYGDSAFTIAPNGDLYKCWEHVGEEQHLVGKIDMKGEISDISFAYFDWMSRNPLNTQACRECSYLPACGGGCGSVSFEKEGSYHAKGCFKVRGVIEKQINFKFSNTLTRSV